MKCLADACKSALFAVLFLIIPIVAAPQKLTGSLNNTSEASTISKSFLTGHINPAKDTSFIRVAGRYTQNIVYLKKATYQAYTKMYDAAAKQGITLNIISGMRTFTDQHYKWDSKWNDGQFAGIEDHAAKSVKMLRWWSMPGTSRHHWGTDIDLTNMKLSFFKSAQGKKMYQWMVQNAAKFGFYQPFNAGRQSGYQEEKWHWSYVPLSKAYLKEYVRQVTYDDIKGFDGWAAAKRLDVINAWVLAVNNDCK